MKIQTAPAYQAEIFAEGFSHSYALVHRVTNDVWFARHMSSDCYGETLSEQFFTSMSEAVDFCKNCVKDGQNIEDEIVFG